MDPVKGYGEVLGTIAAVLCAMVALACSAPAAPAPTQAPPTQAKAAAPATAAPAPAVATRAPEPTKPAATAAPKSNFPEKGKTITLLIPYAAGGGSDITARIFQPYFEKEIGAPTQVVNKGGAGSQIGTTDVFKAKGDGYTIGNAIWPTIITLYLDKDRQAAFGRKDFQALAMLGTDPGGMSVKADSPIKSVKDLVDAAKANPGKVSVGTSGIMAVEDFAFRIIQKQAGVQFNIVAFDGAGPGMTALMGGHIDAFASAISPHLSPAKAGQTRLIATFAPEGKSQASGLMTTEEQGFKGCFGVGRGWFLPAGTPKDVIDSLATAMKVSTENAEFKKKSDEVGMVAQFMGPDQFSKYWDDMEVAVKPLVDEAKQANK